MEVQSSEMDIKIKEGEYLVLRDWKNEIAYLKNR